MKSRSLFTVVIVKENIQVIVYEGSGHALEDPPGRGNDKIRLEAMEAMGDLIKTGVSGP